VQDAVIPLDEERPTYALVVESFNPGQNVVAWSASIQNQVPVGDQMSAQLRTALAKVGNFQLYDERKLNGLKLPKGVKGPYLVRATLTEFSEQADAMREDNSFSLGFIGAIVGIVGAVTGNSALTWSGAGVAAANPSYEDSTSIQKGMVAFDVQIVDHKTGRLVNSFEASGSFQSETNSNGVGIFGYNNSKSQTSSSVAGQALRVAMNDAVRKTLSALE
jgi:curli biogenesis system outer membrane secretion channel CsgG